jgi:hypothetical protein
MHGVLLRPDGSSLAIPLADHQDVTLPHGEIYRGVQVIDNYGQRYWVYLLCKKRDDQLLSPRQ